MGAGPFSITAVSSAVFLFCIPRENNIVVPLQKPPHKMYGGFFSDPVGIRTLDLLIRSQSLYPAELPSHDEEYSHNGTSPLRRLDTILQPDTHDGEPRMNVYVSSFHNRFLQTKEQ